MRKYSYYWPLVIILAATTGHGQIDVRRDGLSVVIGENATQVEKGAARLFAGEVRNRTGLEIQIGPKGTNSCVLLVGTPKSDVVLAAYVRDRNLTEKLAPDGFHLNTVPDKQKRIYVIGESPIGVIAGIGALLRASSFADGIMRVPAMTKEDYPRMPVRGMYFATHFRNFYQEAPIEEVDRVIEDLALWGANELLVWFDMNFWPSFMDPGAQEHFKRLKHFGDTAHGLGMKFSAGFLANEAYRTSPQDLRGVPAARGAYGVELCPSKPEGLKQIGVWQAEALEAYANVDGVTSWPYDQGGCGCEQCAPWGCNGYIRASEQLARVFHKRFPNGKLWLSNWWFTPAENKGLMKYLKENKPDWVHGLISGEPPVLDPVLAKCYPVAWFPEISMCPGTPWGGCGASPMPARFAQQAENFKSRITGGWPYSEGIYEDVSKFFFIRFFWNPKQKADDILAEYARYYLAPECADDAVRLFYLLEKTSVRKEWAVENLKEADNAWSLAQAIDARLPDYARQSWRWRQIYVRAGIDRILKNQGFRTAEAQNALKPFIAEVERINHCVGIQPYYGVGKPSNLPPLEKRAGEK